MSKMGVFILFLAALLCITANVTQVLATEKTVEYKLESHLIWGTDSDKPDDPRLKVLSDSLRNTLAVGKFRWKNYWEVDRKTFGVRAGSTNHVVISKTCEIVIKHLDKETFEVQLFGEKKRLGDPNRKSLSNGAALVLAGPDKNDSAWFVVIMMVPTSTTVAPKVPKSTNETARTNKAGAEAVKPDKMAAGPEKTAPRAVAAGN